MKIKFRLNGTSSAATPPPPPPPPPAAAGIQTSASAGNVGRSKSFLDAEGVGAGASSSDQNLLMSDRSVGSSGSRLNQNPTYGGFPGGDGFLQWSVGRRSSRKRVNKFRRRETPQPSGFGGGSSGGGGISLKAHGNVGSSISRSRNLDNNRMVVGGGSSSGVGGGSSISRSVLGKRPHSAAEKADRKKVPSSCGGPTKKSKPNEPSAQPEQPKSSNRGVAAEVANLNKGSGVVSGLPSIVVGLSKKEKEEDFLQMIGTKLPQKPKRRPRAVEKNLQYCFPGMFLYDVSSSKYEVRERKKSRKSRRKGLKAIVSSDSE